MKRSTVVSLLAGCLVALVAAGLLVVFGAGSVGWLWLEGTGTNRRVSAARQIDQLLRVTVEHAARADGEGLQDPGNRQLRCRIRFENLGDRDISAFTGTILFTDKLGWTVFFGGVGDGRPLHARETVTEDRLLECFARTPSSGSIDEVRMEELDVSWIANSVTMADGSRIEVLPE